MQQKSSAWTLLYLVQSWPESAAWRALGTAGQKLVVFSPCYPVVHLTAWTGSHAPHHTCSCLGVMRLGTQGMVKLFDTLCDGQ